MNRLGLAPEELERLVADPLLLEGIEMQLLMSHLASADDPQSPQCNNATRQRDLRSDSAENGDTRAARTDVEDTAGGPTAAVGGRGISLGGRSTHKASHGATPPSRAIFLDTGVGSSPPRDHWRQALLPFPTEFERGCDVFETKENQ